MAPPTCCATDIPAKKQHTDFAGKVIWNEMLNTLLDHFRNGRNAKILLPTHGQRTIAVDGSVRTHSDHALDIALPYDRDFSTLINPREICQIFFSLQGREYRLLTRIQTILGTSNLLVKPKPPAIALQEREFFRIDARIRFAYYCLGDDQPRTPYPLNTKVNLSASGLRLPAQKNLDIGDLVAMVLWLDGKTPECIECLAQVVRFCTLPNGDMAVAVQFAEIDNQDRDKIVAFCLAKEREILRTKVRTRDLF
ncbi:PilZ domain protein [Syntrophotalea carbinolica DSM 2380]|uniref:PilZ domain protein n=1 Tax=Syntrophotalea carbinolica (strain DSM 2380 / NBRC 103641 / GraBd1) TaxID=338963 RepID=Q3A5J9_SYNC1|nr:PilZ domain-containing protein [Syntrophotalea carbinolica]ABA88358.1 PilZ domain protein [Syntrophotalea carbinolica DSM 2380]